MQIPLFLLIPILVFTQEVDVVNLKHTVRWLNESTFPNYFLLSNVRESIFVNIKQDLTLKLGASDLTFPDKVEYKIINGFGKPKKELPGTAPSSGYEIDINSFLTRGTVGFAVFWKIDITIRKDGHITHKKAVKHEIENANAAAYMTPLRWLSPLEFQTIFVGLFREAIGIESGIAGTRLTDARRRPQHRGPQRGNSERSLHGQDAAG